ncbi:MAG: hypothetical protein AB8U44_02430 [Aaplasma endosymbiont of Hyalomma asiaticum]
MRACSVSSSSYHRRVGQQTGGFAVFLMLIGSVICEYLISGITRTFNPRLDILLLIFTHGRNIAPSHFYMFCAGVLKDCLYFSPLGYSSILCVVANEVFNIFRDKLQDWRWLLLAVVLINVCQWGVSSLVSFKVAPVLCLIPEIAICFVGGLVLRK